MVSVSVPLRLNHLAMGSLTWKLAQESSAGDCTYGLKRDKEPELLQSLRWNPLSLLYEAIPNPSHHCRRSSNGPEATATISWRWPRRTGWYGHLGITALLGYEGWRVTHTRVERIRRQESLRGQWRGVIVQRQNSMRQPRWQLLHILLEPRVCRTLSEARQYATVRWRIGHGHQKQPRQARSPLTPYLALSGLTDEGHPTQ